MCSNLGTEEDFIIEGTKLCKYRGNSSDITIPNSVTEIGDGSFQLCKKLKEITIPKDCEVHKQAFDKRVNVIRR